jgi:hypothetical protein
VVRALISEFRLLPVDWPAVVKIVQSALNNSPSAQRGDIAPLTAFTGRPADSPLLIVAAPPEFQTKSISYVRLQQLTNIAELQDAVEKIHKAVADNATKRRATSSARHNSRPVVQQANFSIGDYVLVAKRYFHLGEKLTLRWRGPRRILSTLSDHVFEVEDLNTGTVTAEHDSRLRFYADASLDVTADLLSHIAHNNQGYDVRALMDLRYDLEAKRFLVLVSWLGFEAQDNTWEPLGHSLRRCS